MKDTTTGLETDTSLPAFVPDPPSRTAPITPYLDDDNSEGVWKPPMTPNQDYPIRDVRPA